MAFSDDGRRLAVAADHRQLDVAADWPAVTV
jgi:hypothetical protein